MVFYKNLVELKNLGYLANCELCLKDGQRVAVSKYILAGHNDHFYNLFKGDPDKSTFTCNKLDKEHFDCYYEYIHKGYSFEVTNQNINKLLVIYYEFNDLADLELSINAYLASIKSKKGSMNTYIPIFTKIKDEKYKNINKPLTKILKEKISKMTCYTTFNKLNISELCLFFTASFIEVNEPLQILRIFYTWLSNDFENKQSEAKILFDKIDYSKITLPGLEKENKRNPIFNKIGALRTQYVKNETASQLTNIYKPLQKQRFSLGNIGTNVILTGGLKSPNDLLQLNAFQDKSGIGKIADLEFKRERHCSELIGSKIYSVGGKASTTVESFDILSNQVTVEPMILPTLRHSFSSCVYNDKFYLFGGVVKKKAENTVDYMDLDKMTWYAERPMLNELMYHETIVSGNGSIYITPAHNYGKMQRFDPRDISPFKSFSNPIKDLFIGSAATIYNDQDILIIGGYCGNNESVDNCQLFDTRSERWRLMPKIPQKVCFPRAVEIGNRIFLFGGETKTNFFTNKTYFYDKSLGRWQEYTDYQLPILNKSFSTIVF
uniref:BTB domain-containing protein n=1 Tax=Rhabditophanes sp. KR3021 TaxID=114890 RepID=A0AC35TMM2_9BILA